MKKEKNNAIKVDDLKYHKLAIGKTGENEYRTFYFDVSEWLKNYPEGKIVGLFKRPDGTTYNVVILLEDKIASWTITATELTVTGKGEFELQIHDGEMVGKSAIAVTHTEKSLGPAEIPDEAGRDWVNKIMEAAVYAENANYPAVVNDGCMRIAVLFHAPHYIDGLVVHVRAQYTVRLSGEH